MLLVASLGAEAQQPSPGNFELTPYLGFRFGGAFEDVQENVDVDLDDGVSTGFIFNLRESGNTQWEVLFSRQATDVDASALPIADPALDISLTTLQIGGTYLGEGSKARPYLAATIGGTYVSPDVRSLDSDTFWSGSLGVGWMFLPTNRVGIRLEARGHATLLSSNSDLFCQSGPGGGLCAVTLDADVLWQTEIFAGAVVRF